MEPKNYQKSVIKDIDLFLNKLALTNNLKKAYEEYWNDKGFTVGFGGMMPYQDIIDGVPSICLKVPTGGGKTLIASSSIKTIYNHYPTMKGKLVLWLCPSDAILKQTINNLKNVNHPYRQKIDVDFSSKVNIVEKNEILNGFNFSPSILSDNLVICVMSYDSLRIDSMKKEQRKIYQDNGQMLEFNTINADTNLDDDTPETALINVIRAYMPLVIVDESHNASSDLSQEMLKRINPSMILELTATPKDTSNVISYVSALELKNEEMVKLPIFLYKLKNAKEVIMDAIKLQSNLEQEAIESSKNGGKYIRPIVLFQAEGKFDDNRETFEKIKKIIVDDLTIDATKVAIKTSNIDELAGVDLLSDKCEIRYIITVNALNEGWDCPFAYILASVSNRNSETQVEQVIGRILRQPYTKKNEYEGLNISYVLTCSDNFSQTADNVIKGLENSGYSKNDVRIEKINKNFGIENNNNDDTEEMQNNILDFNQLFSIEENKITADDVEKVKNMTSSNIDYEAKKAEIENLENQLKVKLKEFEDQYNNDISKTNGVPMDKTYISKINGEYAEEMKTLCLPIFVEEMEMQLFGHDDKFIPFEKEHLNSSFNLNSCDSTINFSFDEADLQKVDLNEKGVIKTNLVTKNEKDFIRKMIFSQMPVKQRIIITDTIAKIINNKENSIPLQHIKAYVSRVLIDKKDENMTDILNNIEIYAEKIVEKIKDLKFKHYYKKFKENIDLGIIKIANKYLFDEKIILQNNNILTKYNKSLYTGEKNDLNTKEDEIISKVASYDNIQWWHRNIDKTEFYINGFLNTYPDFIIKTKNNRIIMLETKGDDRDNTDSRYKLELGKMWASMAGDNYRYFMVFDKKEDAINGSHSADEFLNIIRNL